MKIKAIIRQLLVRWWVKWPTIFFLLLAILAIAWRPSESESVKQNRICMLGKFGIKKITLQLFAYAQDKGEGLYFPDNLETLLQTGYLPTADILKCGPQKIGYHYFTGLRTDMPSNLILLMEERAEHLIEWPNGTSRKFGWFCLLDGSTYLGVNNFNQKNIITSMKQAGDLVHVQDANFLLQTLQQETNEQVQAMALWRLRQIGTIGWRNQEWNVIIKCKDSKYSEVKRQSALLLWNYNRKMALPIIITALNNDNYFIRRDTWNVLFKHKGPKLGYLSPQLAIEWATTHYND